MHIDYIKPILFSLLSFTFSIFPAEKYFCNACPETQIVALNLIKNPASKEGLHAQSSGAIPAPLFLPIKPPIDICTVSDDDTDTEIDICTLKEVNEPQRCICVCTASDDDTDTEIDICG